MPTWQNILVTIVVTIFVALIVSIIVDRIKEHAGFTTSNCGCNNE